MAICRACSSEIIGSDRFCRNCGVAVAPVVAEDDTRRFSPSARLSSTSPGLPDATNPLYAPPSAAYAASQGSAPFSLLLKLLLRNNVTWALIAVMLFTFVAVGIGIGRGMSRIALTLYRGSAEQKIELWAIDGMNSEVSWPAGARSVSKCG